QPPDLFHQALGGHDLVGVEQECSQQDLFLRRPEIELAPVVLHAQRPQNPVIHPPSSPRPAQNGRDLTVRVQCPCNAGLPTSCSGLPQRAGMKTTLRSERASSYTPTVPWGCSACGGENPVGTRFCGHCGAARAEAAAPSASEERR